MQRPVILLVVIAIFTANSANAQYQPATGADSNPNTNQISPWQRFFGPIVDFSRAKSETAGTGGTGTSVVATSPQTPTQEGYQPNVIQSSGMVVPPPPAPAAQMPSGPSPPTTLSVPDLGPPAAPPKVAEPPGNLSVPPPLAPGAEQVPSEDGVGPGSAPASTPPGGIVDPNSRRLRDAPLPGPSEPVPPQQGAVPPQPSAALAGPSLVFRTADVVRPDLMRGVNYRLAEYAPLVDFRFQFEIETPWGTIPAQGMAMLGLRLQELKAIEYGSRIAHKNPMFVEGAVQVACKTPEGAYLLVTDPIDSVYRTAVGLKRIVLAKWSPNGERANCEARRKLACLLACDPESRNPVLLCLLDDMSANASAGWLTADVALNFGLPGLGALAANAEFKRMMAMKSTREIQADLDAALIALGVPEASRTAFLASGYYTTTQRMAFVYYLRKLVGIENLPSLVAGAVDAINESEALASIQELQLLVELRRTHPIVRVTFVGLPIVVLTDGSQMIVASADYLVEAPRIAQKIARYRAEFPAAPTTLVTLGRVSVGAEQEFIAAGICVAHHRLGDDAFNAKAEKAAQLALKPAAPRTP
jgi:hypothetical protein